MATEIQLDTSALTVLKGLFQALWGPKVGDPKILQLIEVINGALATTPTLNSTAFTGAAGTNDNDIIYTSEDISTFNEITIEATAGTVDIEVSLDGTNYNATPVAVLLADATAVGTYNLTITAGKIGILRMHVKKFRIRQNGAVASNARGLIGMR